MIGETEVVELLRAAVDDVDVSGAPARELAAAGRRRRRRRHVVAGAAAAAAVAVVAVTAPLALGRADQHGTSAGASPGSAPTSAAGSCVERVPSRVLPSWARTGFSDPRPRIPYVLGDQGDIVAILFAQPLAAPPAADHGNKILWVSPVADGSSLHITATLPDGTTAERVVDGGPGPSIIDLPSPGCWHLTLEWAGQTDTLDLAYVAP